MNQNSNGANLGCENPLLAATRGSLEVLGYGL
jgi:hypothetical protein